MKTLGHLNTYQVTMTVMSPLFIGSGEQVLKKEYLYIPHENKVLMLDVRKLAAYLDRKKLLDRYQDFLLDENSRNCYNFFRDNGIGRQEYRHFLDYTIDGAGEAITKENLREIKLFVKDVQGKPYIPGSSLKGALRTAILTKMLLEDNRIDRQALAQEWLKTVQASSNANALKRSMPGGTDAWESAMLNTLSIEGKKADDAVKSVMKGIAVSDSAPLEKSQLMLAQKIDQSIAGKNQFLPVSRECLQPGSKCRMTITIDTHIAKETGWTMEALMEAIRCHQKWQQQAFYRHFKGHEKQDISADNHQLILWLGGGVGFANKTINQAAIGEAKALELNAQILQKLFQKNGNHDKDVEIGIAPHMQKMATYQGSIYRMGQCCLEVR